MKKPTPQKQPQKAQDEEEELDEYDDEYYGEEDGEYYGEEYGEEEGEAEHEEEKKKGEPVSVKQPSTSSAPPSKEEQQFMHTFRQLKPEAKNLCLFFVTDSCTYGAQCLNKHDQAQ